MSATSTRTPRSRSMPRLHCKSIRDLMTPTEKLRQPDSIVVCISVDLWNRIYANARKGAK